MPENSILFMVSPAEPIGSRGCKLGFYFPDSPMSPCTDARRQGLGVSRGGVARMTWIPVVIGIFTAEGERWAVNDSVVVGSPR